MGTDEKARPDEPNTATLNLRGLDPKLKDDFRESCLREGVSMTDEVRKFMSRKVKRGKVKS